MAASFFKKQHIPFYSFALFLVVLPCTDSLTFERSRFDLHDTSLAYLGGATVSAGTVEFNSVDYMCQVGQVTYANRVPLWDSRTKKLADFATRFSFYIDIQGSKSYGAGFAFFLAPAGFHMPLNSAGGFLGLFNTTISDSPSNQIVHVEFDSYPNSEWDPQVQHVGINRNSVFSANYTEWNTSLHTGDTADVRIHYNSSTKNLSVSWKYQFTATSNENTSVSYIIDLREVLPEWVTIGFTAATGAYRERHVLQSWQFTSNLVINGANGDYSKRVVLIVSITVSVAALMVVMAIALGVLRRQKLKRRRRKMAETLNLGSINDELQREAGPRRFSYEDLVFATNNFSNDKKLGEGAFGVVYKGQLVDSGMVVAVKKIVRGTEHGKKQYITEVKTISQLRHRNLVQLIGWCHDRDKFLLVCEFMPNGSLDLHLFRKKNPLNWAVRYRIGLGLASALLYLHEEWQQCVVHRDIKSSNIMLDSNFNVKLGDFGLARLMDHELGPQTTGLAGTVGYLAPEYISTGRASKESDVYSFGIVALEIATGRKVVDTIEQKPTMSLVEWIWDLYGTKELNSAIDPTLGSEFSEEQVECLMIVGLWCGHPDHSLRPSIRQALQVLNFEAELPNLPKKMPVPLYQVPMLSSSTTEPSITCSSINEGR